MVEFEYKPWKKIIIHEIMEYPLEYVLFQSTQGVPQGGVGRPLMWSNGVLFSSFVLQPSPDVIKKQLEGIIHWSSLLFSKMEKYQPEIKRDKRIKIPIINVSNHTIFGPMSNWVKKQYF
jgi:hypothetical protein